MKWGIRRYQNPDGSLTSAGRARYGSANSNSVKNAKSIATSINEQVKKDSKPPTGNQNCQLCTWCAEAQFRGINAKPRPVYSPRDPELSLQGETIVKGATRVKAKNYEDLESKIDAVDGDARFYTHVNWEGSEGGHEFLIIKNGDNKYSMDPQAGTVKPMAKNSSYLSGINYNNSYISRLDDKEFDTKLFNEVNDRKNTLKWDAKKDVPFMYENGLLSKEEYEMVMKNPNIMYDSAPENIKKSKRNSKVFISGSSKTQFEDNPYYRKELPKEVSSEIDSIIKNKKRVLVGEAPGVDRQVQNYLKEKNYKKVTVYATGNDPRYLADQNWKVKKIDGKGFEPGSPEFNRQKDIAMTNDADSGLAVVLENGGAGATRNNARRLIEQNKEVKMFKLNSDKPDEWVEDLIKELLE